MHITVYTPTGRKSASLKLPHQLFAAPINKKLLAQAVRVYLSNQRQATKKVKTRGEVRGSRRKIWRQKGTGRARHGDRYAPLFVGGGVAHGPTGKEAYQLKFPPALRYQALASALTAKAQARQIVIIDKLEQLKPKTKLMSQALAKIITQLKLKPKAKLSLILPEKIDSVIQAASNLKQVHLLQARQLHPYQVLNGGLLMFMKPSIKVIKETFVSN